MAAIEFINTAEYAEANTKAYYRFESGALTTDTKNGHTLTNVSGQSTGYSESNQNDYAEMRKTTDRAKVSQGFKISYNGYCNQATLYLSRTGTIASGNVWAEIWSDDGTGKPNAIIGSASGTMAASSVSAQTTFTLYNFTFSSPSLLTAGVQYHLVFNGDYLVSTLLYVSWGMKNPTGGYGNGAMCQYDSVGAAWSSYASGGSDACFYIYTTPGQNASGKFGGAADFNSSSVFSAVDHADFKPTGNFSIGLWLKTSVTGANTYLFSSWSQNTNYAGIQLGLYTDNKIYLFSGKNTGTTGSDGKQAVSTSTVTDGNWHFVVGTWDGANLQIYIDGSADGAAVAWANAPAYAATNYVRIGCTNNTGTNINFFSGTLDDVWLMGRALTATEVSSLYTGSSLSPSISPSQSPSTSISPSISPSQSPSQSISPSNSPSISPSKSPSISPSLSPSISPSKSPSFSPSLSPSISPSQSPSTSISPSISPSFSPSVSPSKSPSISPSQSPSASISPSLSPSISPSISPSVSPSFSPSVSPSVSPSPPIWYKETELSQPIWYKEPTPGQTYTSGYILNQSGGYLLLQTGGKIILPELIKINWNKQQEVTTIWQ